MLVTPPLTPENKMVHFKYVTMIMEATVEKLWLPFSTKRCISMSSSSSKLTVVIFSAASQDSPQAV